MGQVDSPSSVQPFASALKQNKILFLLLLLLIVLRIPNLFEPYWYGDEGIYLTVGQTMNRGSELYAEIIDHKTPIIYWIAAWAHTLIRLKLFLVFSSLVSVVLFYKIARRFFSSSFHSTVATFVFSLLITLPAFEGNIANGEILSMPFILGGVLFFWSSFPKTINNERDISDFYHRTHWIKPILVGALYSLALLLKVPSGFDFAALGLFFLFMIPYVWRGKNIFRTIGYGLLLVLGFVLPILLSIAYFFARGTLDSYFDFGLLYNFRYIAAWGSPFEHPIAVFLSTLPGRLLLISFYSLVVFSFRRRLSLPLRFVFMWFGLTFFASLLSLRPYPHYFIQVTAAAAFLLGYLLLNKQGLRIGIIILFSFSWFILRQLEFQTYATVDYYRNFLSFANGQQSRDDYFSWFDPKTNQTYRVANWIKLNTKPDERLFIWGNEPMIYALADRSPVGRFTVAFHIESFIGAREETLEALRKERPNYIIDFLHQRERFEDFYTFVDSYYVFEESIDSAQIYRLR